METKAAMPTAVEGCCPHNTQWSTGENVGLNSQVQGKPDRSACSTELVDIFA